MLFPVNKITKFKKYSLPQPTQSDFEKWVRHKEENLFKHVLVYYGHGLYMTCDCERVWGTGAIYYNENGREYVIVKDLEAIERRVDDIVIVNKVLVLRQYAPGIDFFYHNTVFNKSPREVVKEYIGLPLSEVRCVTGFNELFDLMRFELRTKRRFIIVEAENDNRL